MSKKSIKNKLKKKLNVKLPKKILPIPNKDKKGFFEKWTPRRDLMNIIHPFRVLIFGKPNAGKSTIIKNIVLRAKPQFEKIIIIHYDASNTKEYDDIKEENDNESFIMMNDIPNPRDNKLFDPKIKKLLIFDDIEYKTLNKSETNKLDRCFGYLSTHKNTSICLASQNMTNIPVAVRRMSNFMIMFKVPDLELLFLFARKIGIKKDDFYKLVNKYIKTYHDSLWFDMTLGSPAEVRRNCYEVIDPNEYKKY
jgi:ribosome biogenesis GTPase A